MRIPRNNPRDHDRDHADREHGADNPGNAVEAIRAACVDGVACARRIGAEPERGRWAPIVRRVRHARLRVCAAPRAVWVWLVGYWPGLAYLPIAARAVVGWSGWSYVARAARLCARWIRRATVALRRATRWTWRRVRPVLEWLWRKAEPYVRDAAGWLVHTAPQLALRLAWRFVRWFVRWAPVTLAKTIGLAAVGLWWLLARLARFILAYPEYAGVLAEAEAEGRARHAKTLRERWRRAAVRRLVGVLVTCVVTCVLVGRAVVRYGTPATVVLVAVAVGVLAGVGRAIRPRPERGPDAPDDEPGPDEPYPIADAHTRAEAADCVARAVRAEGIELRMTGDAARQPWGWQVPVILRRGTPAGLISKLGELETTLDLPTGGLLAATDRTRRARVVLRLAERDPFASLTPAPFHAPGSVSLRDTLTIAQRMDGTDLGLCLLGVHGVVIGNSGAGKSMALRALADAVTACRDAQVWDLDPAGDGLDVFGDAIARPERTPAGIEEALADAVALAESRPKLFSELGMPGAWQPDPQHAAVVVFVDEYHHLSDRAKALAVRLLRIGRKGRVSLILAAAEATSDTLGSAIADTTALKILMPCRHADVRLVLGANMIAEGWRPDRLNPATGESAEDAGKCYVYAAGARDPIVSKIRPLDAEEASERGAHRALHGIAQIDAVSWGHARSRRTDTTSGGTGTPDTDAIASPAGLPGTVDGRAVGDVIDAFGPEAKLWTDEVLARLARLDSDRYADWTPEELAATLRPLGVTPRGIKRDGRNRNGYYRNEIIAAFWGLS
ncbi:hypothetical protein LWC34_06550 [Kibdelosporangium philippinense]|uniref:AAA+ ATPase domain-containing protein n=1 Tax=Kibdelosporangium philippinense TaxID=211113 RepID=A0ABS8Z3I7_9PSEU|nr:AAA family ATPase [Kibdelosporangium philippinense]MCE7002491.1 hypothetical protein [Kibdelosporangium philippinense]